MTTIPVPLGFYIDSADAAVHEKWLPTGIFRGVTTNPTLLRNAAVRLADVPTLYARSRELGASEFFVQTWGAGAEELYAHAQRIRDMAPEAIIKVPTTAPGAQAASRLRAAGVPVLMTAVYSAGQALVAAALGAEYVAPYFNRMFLAGRDAAAEISHMTSAIAQDGSGPLVVAASIKSAQHVVALAGLGVRRFTISPEVIAELFTDDLAAGAVEAFEAHMADVL